MIRIYHSKISYGAHKKLMRKLSSFPKNFENKILSYRRWEDSQRSLLGRLLLRKGLSKKKISLNQQIIQYDKNGKPFLGEKKIPFNISHSGEIVVCAIGGEVDLGIDIELINPIKIEEFRFQMTNLEWNRIVSSNNQLEAFYNYWTQKEAVIKANGNGLAIPLHTFEINNFRTVLNTKQYHLNEITLSANYKCHLASIEELTGNFCVKKIEVEDLLK